MSRHDDRTALRQMYDHTREAIELTHNQQRQALNDNRLLSLALTRLLEIIGEAACRVSPAYRAVHPEIPWAQMISLRNRLIHGYDAIDFDILWEIVQQDLPPLVEILKQSFEE